MREKNQANTTSLIHQVFCFQIFFFIVISYVLLDFRSHLKMLRGGLSKLWLLNEVALKYHSLFLHCWITMYMNWMTIVNVIILCHIVKVDRDNILMLFARFEVFNFVFYRHYFSNKYLQSSWKIISWLL